MRVRVTVRMEDLVAQILILSKGWGATRIIKFTASYQTYLNFVVIVVVISS